MPNKNNKFANNVAGKMYVDDSCIACDACVTAAPACFAMDENDGHAYVKKQPNTPEEEERAREAMETCPVEAIGNDGES
ncbi:MAG: ferredoxin [Proteobacteria bacterium SG_bin7]|nr:MAG: ferredoxin [Proteobacteria bacterium SG_bin7]